MKIAIEAQRIFRTNKHGMDFVALETIRRLQRLDRENEYYILVSPEKTSCLSESANFHIVEISSPPLSALGAGAHCRAPCAKSAPTCCTARATRPRCRLSSHPPGADPARHYFPGKARRPATWSMYQNLGWHYRRLVVPRILPHCRKVITVSRFEQQRIQQALQLPEGVDRQRSITA